VGWGHTLGTAALSLLLLLAITGIFQGLYFSPHPEAAWQSVRFIDHDVPFGRLVRGVHHHGASLLILVLILHLGRTFWHAAYKPPRELTWLLGLALLGLVLAFGLTGVLLPWDQNAYWGTRVRTDIVASVPGVGAAIRSLLRGGDPVGALTLTRFYGMHTLLLPALLLAVGGAHAWLAWRHGPTVPSVPAGAAAPPADVPRERDLARHAAAALGVWVLAYALAILRPVELEFRADPADVSYHAHPEWYFLFLNQLIQLWSRLPVVGKQEWIATLLLPGLALAFLALAPWLDRRPERAASRRPVMVAVFVLGLAGLLALTVMGFAGAPLNATPRNSLYARFTGRGERPLDPGLVRSGREAFSSARPVPCSACHRAYSDFTAGMTVDLTGYGRKSLPHVTSRPESLRMPFYDRIVAYVRGDLRPPATKMPKYPADQLPQEQLDAIAAYLSQDPAEPVAPGAAGD